MQLTRSQVKTWLDTFSKDDTRPVLCGVYIDTYKDQTVVVGTDGYVLAALDAPGLASLVGRYIKREEIVKWYKLATGKDSLTDDDLTAMTSETPGKYPDWQQLIPKEAKDDDAMAKITINASYLNIMQLLNNAPLTWELHGSKFSPVTANANNNLYVVMPLKG